MTARRSSGQTRDTAAPEYFAEPPVTRWLFASPRPAWIWLVARIWLGWIWLRSGWGKVFGGNITWRVWEWGRPEYSLTGDGNIGWVRGGTTIDARGEQVTLGVGDAVAAFAGRAVELAAEPRPPVQFGWYVRILEWIRDSAYPVVGPLVAVGEVLIGVGLILGAFTGLAAFFGAMLNFTFLFAGTAGVNPAMVLVSVFLVLAWRNAGWIGLDRMLLPMIGTPWQPGPLFGRRRRTSQGDRGETP